MRLWQKRQFGCRCAKAFEHEGCSYVPDVNHGRLHPAPERVPRLNKRARRSKHVLKLHVQQRVRVRQNVKDLLRS